MAASIMLSHQREFATILAFDVPVSQEMHQMAEEMGVKVFTADIIYHLFDQFTAYMDKIVADRKRAAQSRAHFPVQLEILPQHIFMQKNPIVVGVRVVAGILKKNTPLCVVKERKQVGEDRQDRDVLVIGHVASIEKNNAGVEEARKGDEVCVKIEQNMEQNYIQYGRQFNHKNNLFTKMSRECIDLLKENFKEDLEKEDWMLVVKIKGLQGIL